MLKRMVLATATCLALAGATMLAVPASAEAGHQCTKPFKCVKKAHKMYPGDREARHAYRKACHARHKAWKKAHKEGLLARLRD